jgi:hypothetical protein
LVVFLTFGQPLEPPSSLPIGIPSRHDTPRSQHTRDSTRSFRPRIGTYLVLNGVRAAAFLMRPAVQGQAPSIPPLAIPDPEILPLGAPLDVLGHPPRHLAATGPSRP